jgi:hypothetical protein
MRGAAWRFAERVLTSALHSPRCRRTSEGQGGTRTLVLRRRSLWRAMIKRLLTPAPVGRRVEWAVPGHAAPGAASIWDHLVQNRTTPLDRICWLSGVETLPGPEISRRRCLGNSRAKPVARRWIPVVLRAIRVETGRCGSFQNLVFERDAFRGAFLQPGFLRVLVCQELR